MNQSAFDTVPRVGFSEDAGFIRGREDVGGAMEAATKRLAYWNYWWTIPWLEAIL